jgi:hypothetical protein
MLDQLIAKRLFIQDKTYLAPSEIWTRDPNVQAMRNVAGALASAYENPFTAT